MTWESILFLIVAPLAFGISFYRFHILYRLIKTQKGKSKSFGDIPARIWTTIVNVLLQKSVLKRKAAGFMHLTIFWGFIVITLGTIEQFAITIYPGASFEFIGETPYAFLVFVQDTFTFLVLLAVAFAFVRRLIVRPKHLYQSIDAVWVLIFTGGLMKSIFLMNAFHTLSAQPWYAQYMPFSSFVAGILSYLGWEQSTYAVLYTAFKWIHMMLVMGFSVYIPGSKHLHIVAAGPNIALRTLPREKAMPKINFEDESVTQYGAAKITDLSGKDVLDFYSCTECGRCQEVCPAWATSKPLSPMLLIHDLKANLFKNKSAILAGQTDSITSIIDEKVTEDVIWACTSCRACEIACPVFIEHTDKIYETRRNLVLMESKFPSEVQTVFKNMETNATPWAFNPDDRDKWADGLEIPRLEGRTAKEFDVIVWVGCAGAFDERSKKVLKSFVNLLKKAQVSFAILGKEEKCTGDPARRIGNEYLYQSLATTNVETLNKYSVKSIVTSCPHCFNTLKNEYPAFGGNYEVFHHSQFLAKLLADGKLKPTQEIKEQIAFHDSCYMGRWNNEYEGPRAILNALPGSELKEMSAHHEKSMCCGAGGGRMWMEEKIGERINVARTEQALETGASVIASSCPFCMTMLTDGVKAKEQSQRVRVYDIAELLDESTK